MKRREFITLLCGAAASPMLLPIGARAQQGQMRRIGVLLAGTEGDADVQGYERTMREGLQNLGWVEGRNIEFQWRWAAADPQRMQKLASELVESRPDLLCAATTPITRALQQATRTIPIVFVVVSDPVGDEIVQSLARPGGNLTGFINIEAAMGGKWVELLKEVAPDVRRVAALFNPDTAPGGGRYYARAFEAAAATFNLEAILGPCRTAADVERLIADLARAGHAGLVSMPGGAFQTVHRKAIIALTTDNRIPAIYPQRLFPADGGLMSYGPQYLDLYRRAAGYVDRILRGEKPGDLPVQVPTKFEFVINLKSATALGLTVPPTLLVRADEVIE